MKEWIYTWVYFSKLLFLKIILKNNPFGSQTQQIDSKNQKSAKNVCKLLYVLLINKPIDLMLKNKKPLKQ